MKILAMPRSIVLMVLLAVAGIARLSFAQDAGPTQFQYQGRLTTNGSALTSPINLSFTLFDAAEGGSIVAGPITKSGVTVQNGVFTVALDFGVPATGSSPRWLEVTVLPVGDPVVLLPRTLISATPGAAVAFAVPVYSGQPFVPFAGAVRFNPLSKDFEGYNGLFWLSLTGKPAPNPTTQSFASAGTFSFVVPAGVHQLYVELWGGGGGGGGAVDVKPSAGVSKASTSGGSGGGGGYAASILSVAPGESLTITVGQGGAGGSNTNNILLVGGSGSGGGTTSVARDVSILLSATGGEGGGGGIYTLMSSNGACSVPPVGLIALGGGPAGVGSGGNYANSAGISGGNGSYGYFGCDGLLHGGVGLATGPAPSAFQAAGLPLSGGGLGAGGPGATGRSCTDVGCGGSLPASSALTGNDGGVRIYWY